MQRLQVPSTGIFNRLLWDVSGAFGDIGVLFAIAVATGLGADVINAAGIVMGLLLIFLALTGFSEWLGGVFPLSVIRGIQLGLGFLLVKTSLGLMHADLLMAVVSGT